MTLREKQIGFCRGCLACQRTGSCVQKDDAQEIVAKMNYADTIVFATPIYYYELSGQMKTLLDRANPLYGSDYHFREVFLLTAAAEDAPGVDRRAIGGLQGWIDCFDQVRLAGSLFAGGVNAPGEIDGHDALRQAYELGLSQR